MPTVHAMSKSSKAAVESTNDLATRPKSSVIYFDDAETSKSTRIFHRQMSKEEQRYQRNLATFKKMVRRRTKSIGVVDSYCSMLIFFVFF
jgi:hypothetical protein